MRNRLAFTCLFLAGSISLTNMFVSWAENPVNTTQNGRIVKGGTYYNTPGNRTTFINKGSGGLWVKAGTIARGLEIDAQGNSTDTGGTFHFYAPGNVVRVDGTIDVSGFINGGKVFIDSAYLFQSGNIFANGINAGLIQANVGAMTMGPAARMEARGRDFGAGGAVSIHSSGPVDIRRNAVIDTSGPVSVNFDTNVINIEGSLIQNEGILRAASLTAPIFGSSNSKGGTIRLVASGQSVLLEIKDALQAANQNATGDTSAPTISNTERNSLLQRVSALIRDQEGDIHIARSSTSGYSYTGEVNASGILGRNDLDNDYTSDATARAGDGGSIIITASGDIKNQGIIRANGSNGDVTNDAGSLRSVNSTAGGNGGTIILVAQGDISNSPQGQIEANGGVGADVPTNNEFNGGDGGDGGLIAIGYNNNMLNQGAVRANGGRGGAGPVDRLGNNRGIGGNGGLIVFSGNGNPTGGGRIDANGAIGGNNNPMRGGTPGTIVSPNPAVLGNTQTYRQQGYIPSSGALISNPATQQTQTNELLTHRENLILLTRNGGSAPAKNLFDRLVQARVRSVEDPISNLGKAFNEVINKNTETSNFVYRNLIIGSSRDRFNLDLTHPYISPAPAATPFLVTPSPLSRSLAFTTLNTLNIVNDGSVQTLNTPSAEIDEPTPQFDFWVMSHNHLNLGGGHIALLANGRVTNLNTFGTTGVGTGGSIHIAATEDFRNGNVLEGILSSNGEIHGGSIILKASRDVIHNDNNFFLSSRMRADGGLLGGTVHIGAKRDFIFLSNGGSTISANGALQGGSIIINADNNNLINVDRFNSAFSPGSHLGNIDALGFSDTEGQGGFIKIHGNNSMLNAGVIEANGGRYGGTVSLTAGDRVPGNERLTDELALLQTEAFAIRGLTPPITPVSRTANLRLNETVYNSGTVNALGGPGGQNGRIYLGGNRQVVIGINVGDGLPEFGGVLNGIPVSYFNIVNSPSPATAFQTILQGVQNNGGHVYVVSGQALTNVAGRTRTTVEVVNAESAPNVDEPDVNPLQNNQGSELPNDFRLLSP